MKTPRQRYPRLSQWVVGFAVVLFSTAGIAAIMSWRSSTDSADGGIVAPASAATSAKAVALTASTTQKRARAKARALGRCTECGQIESIGHINEHNDDSVAGVTDELSAGDHNEPPLNPTVQSEVVVRMADGSRRVFNSANPALWRLGERVIIIAGSIPPQR